ncbi:TonB-dependent receptor [Novosphingobium sp. MW5]|nr:TonB-dependent receptor [Novosphingobium sp. MW5]
MPFDSNQKSNRNVISTFRFCASASLAGLTFALAAQPALAQETDDQGNLSEIVVTAQKRSENLQRVPVAITAVSSSELQASGVTSPFDLGNAAAGIQINNTVQTFSPHIRGVGTTSFGPGVESPVALYVDNIYYGSTLMAPSDLGDLEQLAVLKGPQGTLFGRNATGGVLQVTTLEPGKVLKVDLRTEIDNYGTSRSMAHVSGPLSERLAAGLTVKYATQAEGWGQNLLTGNDVHKIDDDFAVRGKINWSPTDTTTIKLSGDYGYRKNSLGANIVAAGPAGIPDVITFGPSTPIVTAQDNPAYNSDYDVATSFDNKNHWEGGGGSLQIDQDVGFAHIVSITGYRQYKFDSIFDTDPSPIPLERFEIYQKGKQFTQELQLVSNSNQKLTWTLGAFYFWNQEEAVPLRGEFTLPSIGVFLPSLTGVNTLDTFSDVRSESIAVFGQATYKITDSTRITAGLRYTHEKRSSSGFILAYVDNDPSTSFPLVPTVTSEDKTDQATWRVSIDQDIGPDAMVYASYNRGFKSGGFNGFNPTNPPYQPEKIDAYEIGLKSELANRTIRFNPSAFYYKYSQIQITSLIPPPLPIILNAAKAEIYGLDLETQWAPTPDLTFNLSAEWLSAKFTDYPDGNVTVPLPGGGNVIVLGDLSGKRLPFAAKFTLNAGVNYTHDFAGGKITLNANDAYNSGYSTETDGRLKIGSFHMVNASISWTDKSDRFTVGVFGRNLADEHIPAQLSTTYYGDEADFSLAPRTFGISLAYKFGS